MSISRNVPQRVQLTVLLIRSGETVCASCLYEGFVIVLIEVSRNMLEHDTEQFSDLFEKYRHIYG